MTDKLIQVTAKTDTYHATAGIWVDEDGTVVKAAPVYKWMVGKQWTDVMRWKKIETAWECDF